MSLRARLAVRAAVLVALVAAALVVLPSSVAPWATLVISVLFAAAEHVVLTRWMRGMVRAVARLAERDHAEYVPEAGSPELRAFAQALNRLIRSGAVREEALNAALRDAGRQRDRLDSIFTASSDGLLLYSSQGAIVAANPKVAELLGFSSEQLAALSPEALQHDLGHRCATPETYQAQLQAHFDDPAATHEDVLVVERPRRRVVKRLSSPVLHDGAVVGRVFTYTDVSAEWEVDQIKNEFVSTASHELRTPLTALHAGLQLVLSGSADALDPEDREMLAISIANAERLVRLVNDLLDLSKIEAGRMPLALAPIALELLLLEAAQTMEPFGRERQVTVQVEGHGQAWVLADRDQLLRVVYNLLSNAVKYSPAHGHVMLEYSSTADRVEVVVADRGPGIAADQVDRLFRPFSRVGAQERQTTGGTGLGLAISRALVEQHGGRMWWEPNEPAGSRFVFSLPSAVAASAAHESTHAA